MKFIDLSHPIKYSTKTYPSDPDIEIKNEKSIKNDNSLVHSFKLGTHTGTHLDVPSHIFPDGKNLDDFDLSSFSGKAIIVRSDEPEYLDKINQPIEGLIYNANWYKEYNDPKIFFGKSRPIIPPNIIKFVVDNNLKFFGCDLPSVDESGTKSKPIHNSLLGNNIIIYESLNNLGQLPDNLNFNFFGVPLPFENFDGSPVRAFAVI
tara:strand:+ start:3111 stop:3725 length:615 start_codon:yes stop_codon:yes gene_type:complete